MSDPITEAREEAERLASRAGRDLTRTAGARVRLSYRRALEESDATREAATSHEARMAEWPAFVRETFGRLFDEDGMSDLPSEQQSTWGQRAMTVLEEQGAWGELRAASASHRGIAADAAVDLSRAVASAMGVDKLPEGQGDADPRDAADVVDAAIAAGAAPEIVDAMRATATRSAARRAASLANLQQALRSGVVASAVAQIAKEAADKAATVRVLRGCGLGSDGAADPDGEVPIELVKALAGDARLRAIFDLVGRMKEATSASLMTKAPTSHGEIVGVTTGSAVDKLIGAELCMLNSDVGIDVLRRVIEGSACVWECNDDEPKSKGPMVLILDRSGSMDVDGRHTFARAVAIAGISLCAAQKRAVAVVAFAGKGVVDVAHALPGDTVGLRRCIEVCTLPPTGSTDIVGALVAAREAAKHMVSPDAFLVTDACFPPPPRDLVRGATGEGGRLFVLGIGDGARLAMPDADKVWRVSGAPTMDNAAEVLSAMVEDA